MPRFSSLFCIGVALFLRLSFSLTVGMCTFALFVLQKVLAVPAGLLLCWCLGKSEYVHVILKEKNSLSLFHVYVFRFGFISVYSKGSYRRNAKNSSLSPFSLLMHAWISRLRVEWIRNKYTQKKNHNNGRFIRNSVFCLLYYLMPCTHLAIYNAFESQNEEKL